MGAESWAGAKPGASDWSEVYAEALVIRDKHGCTEALVYRSPDDAHDVYATHAFPSVEQARAFADDHDLHAAMQQAGVTSAPRVEIFELT